MGGCHIYTLSWTAHESGIIDNRWHGLQFPAGICIIMSNECVKYVVQHKYDFKQNVIDDVAFGIFCKEHNIVVSQVGNCVINAPYQDGVMVYRNKHANPKSRKHDVYNMLSVAKAIQVACIAKT